MPVLDVLILLVVVATAITGCRGVGTGTAASAPPGGHDTVPAAAGRVLSRAVRSWKETL